MRRASLSALLLACAAGGLMLSGCAALRNDYVDPTTGPTAQLTVQNDTDMHVRLDLYEQASTCEGRRKALAPNPESLAPTRRTSVRIGAGAPLSFTLTASKSQSGVAYSCFPTVTFTPEANVRYTAQFLVSQNKCAVVLTGNGCPVPKVTPRRWTNGFTEASSFCKAD